VDPLNAWYDQFVNTPVGALLTFLLIFLMRVALDDRLRRRDRAAKPTKPKKTT
jgi:hypothetical protein